MIVPKKTDIPKRPVKYLALFHSDGRGKLRTVGVGEINRVVAHETQFGFSVVGEYGELHHAERAMRLAIRGWRRINERKTGT